MSRDAMTAFTYRQGARGFTLIELSIVLVIIGLIIGGVLVGQDLIRAAQVRGTISQIEKYNTAVNTFQGKYGALPGDLNAASAAQLGFAARAGTSGQGDGNGIIQGTQCNGYGGDGLREYMGETSVFWVDLSTAGLIDGTFNTAFEGASSGPNVDITNVESYFPQAKLGGGNYIYVWSGGIASPYVNGINYFGLSVVPSIQSCSNGAHISGFGNTGITVAQASAIDTKMDDGFPATGHVSATGPVYGNNAGWSGIGWGGGVDNQNPSFGIPASATTCFDNAGVASGATKYSMTQNNGAGVNCALSFQFQ